MTKKLIEGYTVTKFWCHKVCTRVLKEIYNASLLILFVQLLAVLLWKSFSYQISYEHMETFMMNISNHLAEFCFYKHLFGQVLYQAHSVLIVMEIIRCWCIDDMDCIYFQVIL